MWCPRCARPFCLKLRRGYPMKSRYFGSAEVRFARDDSIRGWERTKSNRRSFDSAAVRFAQDDKPIIGMKLRDKTQGVSAPLPSPAVFAGVDGGAGFAVGFAALFGLPLVPILLALGHGEFALYPSVAKIEAGGDERVALDLRLLE